MVVFEQGVPNKKLYRRFNIRSVNGIDDFASIEEVLLRRFKRWQDAHTNDEESLSPDLSQEPSHQNRKNDQKNQPDPAFTHLPDLLIVDGGKGQLQRAVAVLEKYQLHHKVLS
jgi:excinuclease ABC subunit C